MVNSQNLAINSFVRHYSSAGAIINDWNGFVEKIGKIYENCRKYSDGEVASYIPQLKNVDTERYALSVRTIDGKFANWGDTKFKYCLQSVSKPFTYSMAIDERGDNYVHKYVGQEPSGRNFNDICLDKLGRPHNPMINAGAIVVTSMLKPELKSWDRFDYILKQIRRFAGNNELTFDNTTYVSEKETGHQNYAISHFLKQNNCYPNNESIDLKDVLELYFQHCSIQTNTETMAIMAATLANGGIDPLNNERVVSEKAVQHTLSLMFSCGMYDYSGQMAFKVGLPAKSGVSGNMIIVVPNLMGIALYSPRLDQWGNTVRGVKFSEELVSTFHLHLMGAGTRCAVCNSKRLI